MGLRVQIDVNVDCFSSDTNRLQAIVTDQSGTIVLNQELPAKLGVQELIVEVDRSTKLTTKVWAIDHSGNLSKQPIVSPEEEIVDNIPPIIEGSIHTKVIGQTD